MPIVDDPVDSIFYSILYHPVDPAYFTTLDVKHEYIKEKSNAETSLNCNSNLLSGKRTGLYRFLTGFYDLTDVPAAFQKVMDYTLALL